MISGVQALEVCYENVLYKFTFDIDIDIDKPGRWGLTVEKLYNDRPFFIVVNQEVWGRPAGLFQSLRLF